MKLRRAFRCGQALVLLLASLSAGPLMAAESAVAVKPADSKTIRDCFQLASLSLLKASVNAVLAEADGEEPEEEIEDGGYEGMPTRRATYLGWELALADDQRSRGLSADQIEAESKDIVATITPVMLADMRGELSDQRAHCLRMLKVSDVGGKIVIETTPALDPADLGDPTYSEAARAVDDETLSLCLGRAEMARLSGGAFAIGSAARFYRLRRDRDPSTYDEAVAQVLAKEFVRLQPSFVDSDYADRAAYEAKRKDHYEKVRTLCNALK